MSDPQKWQPIATAPKDGTQVLLVIAGYRPLCGRWRDRWTSDPDEMSFGPTHWMPLPDPPEAA